MLPRSSLLLVLISLKYISDALKAKHAELGIDALIGYEKTFHGDRLRDPKADYVLANSPLNGGHWCGAGILWEQY